MTLNTASVTISDYDRVMEEMEQPGVAELFEAARLYNEHLYYGTAEEGEDRCLNETSEVICYLDIPKISVYLPVYYGTSDEVLMKGCGYIEKTSLPVGGVNTNAGMSGHTGLPGAELLSKLDQLKEKDYFYVHILGEILAYQVEMIKVVEPDEAADLEIIPGKDCVTLVTCTPYGINSHRLLVRGERVPYEVEQTQIVDAKEQVRSGMSKAIMRQWIVIAVILVSAAGVVLMAMLYNRKLKQENGS